MAKVLSTEKVSRRTLGAIAITGMFGRTSFKTSAKFPLTEAADAATSKSGQTPENILPNVQWQVWSALAGAFWNENDKAWRLYCVTKMNREGTGTQYPIVCDRFDVLNNNPTFYTKNTQQLKNGDLVLKPYASASGSTKCCSREGRFVVERTANITAFGCPDDRLSPLLDRVPTALWR